MEVRENGAPDTVGPSDRLQLEVLLVTEARRLEDTEDTAAPPPTRGTETCTVLSVVAEVDLRYYIRDCLRDRADLRVVETLHVQQGLDALAREGIDLLIADRSALAGGVVGGCADLPVPILLVGDGPPVAGVGARRVEILALPFNARRLHDAVQRLVAGRKRGS
jgi:hypothetical protein